MAARIVGKRVEWSVVFSTVFESVEFGVGVDSLTVEVVLSVMC